MGCREAGLSACPSTGNRCEFSRAYPGPQRNLAAIVGAYQAPDSYSHLSPVVIFGGLILIGQFLEGGVKSETIPHRFGIDKLGSGHPTVLHHRVENAGTGANIGSRLDARQSARRVSQAIS